MKRVALVVGVIVVVAVLGYLGWFYLLQPSAEQVLERVAKTYASAEDYTERTKVIYEQSAGGRQSKTDYPTTFIFKRPNKMRLEYGPEPFGRMTIVSDGENAYVQPALVKQCKKSEAPAKLSELAELKRQTQMLGDAIDVLSLLEGADLKEKIASLSLAKGRLVRQQPMHVLSVEFKDGGTQKLWIGKRDWLIHKEEWHPSLKPIKEMLEGMGRGAGEGMGEMFADLEISRSNTLEEARTNSGVEDTEFAFQPAEGVKIVEDWEGLGSGRAEETDLIGKPAPEFTLADLDGNTVKLSDLRGKPALLDFWATSCPPCCEELPQIQEIHESYSAKGLRVIAISSDFSRETVEKYVKENKLTFTVVWLDPSSTAGESVGKDYKVTAIPRVLIIDKGGVIRADFTGLQPKSELLKELKKVGL